MPLFNADNDEIVEQDEVIGWELALHKTATNERHYAIQLEILDPAQAEHPVPCECQTAKCTLISALLDKEDQDLASCS